MNREAVVALFASRDEAWKRRDAAALAAHHAEDAIVESPMQGIVRGRQRIEEIYVSWFKSFPDLIFTGKELLVDGDAVAQFFALRGTQSAPFGNVPPTGRKVDFNGVCLFTLGPTGEFLRERRLYDVTGVLVQLGVLKSKPA
jgi:steroid delta-isomerase-like uncharacterized protein